MKSTNLFRTIAITAFLTTALVACGGGGDASPTGASIVEQPKSLSFSGTVAIGAALSNVVVQVQCGEVKASSGPTDISGNYAVNLTAKLPCKFEVVEPKTGFVLRSLSDQDGTVNISPLTEAIYQFANGDTAQLVTAKSKLGGILDAMSSPLASDPISSKFTADETGLDKNIVDFVKVAQIRSTNVSNPYAGISRITSALEDGQCYAYSGAGTTINTKVVTVCPEIAIQVRLSNQMSPNNARLANKILDAIFNEINGTAWPAIKDILSSDAPEFFASSGAEDLTKRMLYYTTAAVIEKMNEKQLQKLGVEGVSKVIVNGLKEASIPAIRKVLAGEIKAVNLPELVAGVVKSLLVDKFNETLLEGILVYQQDANLFQEVASGFAFGSLSYAIDAGSSAAIGCVVAPPACGLIAIGGTTASWIVKDIQLLYEIRNVRREIAASGTSSAVNSLLQQSARTLSEKYKTDLVLWAKSNQSLDIRVEIDAALYRALDQITADINNGEANAICPGAIREFLLNGKCNTRLDSPTFTFTFTTQTERLNKIAIKARQQATYCESAIAAEREVGVSKCLKILDPQSNPDFICTSPQVLKGGTCTTPNIGGLPVIGTTAIVSGWCGQNLNFNNGVLPSNWTSSLVRAGPGLVNNRLQGDPTDNGVIVESLPIAMSTTLSKIIVDYTANHQTSYWGMYSGFEFKTASGSSWSVWITNSQYVSGANLRVRLAKGVLFGGSGTVAFDSDQNFPYSQGVQNVHLEFVNGSVQIKITNVSDGSVVSSNVALPASFVLSDLTAARHFTYTNTGASSWSDDLSIQCLK